MLRQEAKESELKCIDLSCLIVPCFDLFKCSQIHFFFSL